MCLKEGKGATDEKVSNSNISSYLSMMALVNLRAVQPSVTTLMETAQMNYYLVWI